MVSLTNRRSVMTLLSGVSDPYSHQIRMVLSEKAVSADIVQIEPDDHNKLEDLHTLNPDGTLPTLVDRGLALYDSTIIMEFLDERFPHPPLLPVYPIARAKSRLIMYRMKRDWYSLYDKIMGDNKAEADKARQQLKEGLIALTTSFGKKSFFLSDEFSLIDCYIAPLLWRLLQLDIHLPASSNPIYEYADRIFEREGFKASLTEVEKELR